MSYIEDDEIKNKLLDEIIIKRGFVPGDDISDEDLGKIYDEFEEKFPQYIEKINTWFYKDFDLYIRNLEDENELGEFEELEDDGDNYLEDSSNILTVNILIVEDGDTITKEELVDYFNKNKKYIYFEEGKDFFDVLKLFEDYPKGVITICY